MTSYVITDRTTATKYAISVDDGELQYTSTSDSASDEPIVEDYSNGGTYWKIFIDDGEMAVESTATTRNDSIVLDDATLSVSVKLIVDDGQLGYIQTSSVITIPAEILERYVGDDHVLTRNDITNICLRYESSDKLCI